MIQSQNNNFIYPIIQGAIQGAKEIFLQSVQEAKKHPIVIIVSVIALAALAIYVLFTEGKRPPPPPPPFRPLTQPTAQRHSNPRSGHGLGHIAGQQYVIPNTQNNTFPARAAAPRATQPISNQRSGGGYSGQGPNNQPSATTPSSGTEWEDTTKFKTDLLVRAQVYFNSNISSPEKLKSNDWEETAKKVNDYFQSRIACLGTGENVAIPFYYHATGSFITYPKDALYSIAKTHTLNESKFNCVQGPGVYFSNSDESHNDYGPYTIAMDPSLVEGDGINVTYSFGLPCTKTSEEMAAWMCLPNSDLILDATKVAYVIVPKEEDIIPIKQDLWGESKVDYAFFVDTITRDVADEIRKSIKGVHIHKFHKDWKEYLGTRVSIRGITRMVA